MMTHPPTSSGPRGPRQVAQLLHAPSGGVSIKKKKKRPKLKSFQEFAISKDRPVAQPRRAHENDESPPHVYATSSEQGTF